MADSTKVFPKTATSISGTFIPWLMVKRVALQDVLCKVIVAMIRNVYGLFCGEVAMP